MCVCVCVCVCVWEGLTLACYARCNNLYRSNRGNPCVAESQRMLRGSLGNNPANNGTKCDSITKQSHDVYIYI